LHKVTFTFNLRRERVQLRSDAIKPSSHQKLNVDAKSVTTYRPTLIKLYTGTVDKLNRPHKLSTINSGHDSAITENKQQHKTPDVAHLQSYSVACRDGQSR